MDLSESFLVLRSPVLVENPKFYLVEQKCYLETCFKKTYLGCSLLILSGLISVKGRATQNVLLQSPQCKGTGMSEFGY